MAALTGSPAPADCPHAGEPNASWQTALTSWAWATVAGIWPFSRPSRQFTPEEVALPVGAVGEACSVLANGLDRGEMELVRRLRRNERRCLLLGGCVHQGTDRGGTGQAGHPPGGMPSVVRTVIEAGTLGAQPAEAHATPEAPAGRGRRWNGQGTSCQQQGQRQDQRPGAGKRPVSETSCLEWMVGHGLFLISGSCCHRASGESG